MAKTALAPVKTVKTAKASSQSSPQSSSKAFLAQLTALTDAEAVLTGAAAEPYYHDVYRARETPLAVVRPASVEHLQAVVREAVKAGVAVCPRGGGASYTDAYLPTSSNAIVIDTGRLNRVVEINEKDAYVTVESGISWVALKEALDPLGLRTPFFGPFSGFMATVGGSVSQNSVSHGSGAHGISAQSVISLDVVLASGEMLRTGSAARDAAPFSRHYGPDLTGLFTGDCGALGVKARITLPLLKRRPAFQAASFAFPDFAGLAEMMRLVSLERLDDEHFAIDAALAQGQIARQDVASMVNMVRSVLASSPNLIAAGAQLVKMALAGTREIGKATFMLHLIIEGVDQAEAKARLARVRKLVGNGHEIANSIPVVVRGMPFAPFYNVLGPKGERWLPMHGIIANSRAVAFHDALTKLYAKKAAQMTKLGIWTGGMFEQVSQSAMLYEVAFYWPGAQTAYHKSVVPADYLAALPTHAHNDKAAALVYQLKQDITELMAKHDAIHFQLGKTYPYADRLLPQSLDMLKSLKAQVDPKGLMNPGALGL